MPLSQVYDVLDAISVQSSLNAKRSMISSALSIPWFKETVYFAYNPFMKFQISQLRHGETDNLQYPIHRGAGIFEFLREMAAKNAATLTDHRRLVLLASSNPKTRSVVERILKGDLRCGASHRIFREFMDIPIHETMLCSRNFEKFLELAGSMDNVVTSLKLDGVRCWAVVQYGRVKYLSRSGKEFPYFSVFDNEILEVARCLDPRVKTDPVIFDGEVITSDKSFQKLLTQFRRLKDVNNANLRFQIFDMPMPFSLNKRLRILEHYIPNDGGMNLGRKIGSVPHFAAESPQQILALLDEVAAEGEEGLVAKILNSPYEYKRSDYWCKLKKFETEDLPVVGLKVGTGKYAGMTGSLICLFNGVEVNVGSGYSDQERRDFYQRRPKKIEVKFKEVTKDGSLREPIFVRVRDDI